MELTPREKDKLLIFTAALLADALALDAPAVYWMNTSAARMPGVHEYSLTLSLVETPLRALQQAEGKTTGLSWFSNGRYVMECSNRLCDESWF